jgi:hypothetical protein
VLYLHVTHRLAGVRADDFAGAYRDVYVPALASDDDARLLWFLHHAHGTGPSYTVVTVTAVRDGAAWDRLARRTGEGDLREWARDVEAMRVDVDAKVLAPVAWSALQDVDLAAIPTNGTEHEPGLYMEDTVWPFPDKLDAYIEAAGTLYAQDTIARRRAEGTGLLDLRGAFRTINGAHAGREVVLWQRVVRPEMLTVLFTREVPPEHRAPGTWMHDALA